MYIFLTFSLAHVAVAHSPVSRRTLTVVATFGVLTDLRAGAKHLTLIDVCEGKENFWSCLSSSADLTEVVPQFCPMDL